MTLVPSPTIAILLLAAGSSQRLGQPKQLVPFRNTTLIRYLGDISAASKAHDVTVVVGASADRVREELKDLRITIKENRGWKEGIGSSIRCGLEEVSANADAALLMLCDQPKVTTSLLDLLIDTFATTGGPIVASEYDNTVGVPALFSRKLFSELGKLTGDAGAKRVLNNHMEEIVRVSFPGGAVDIDVPADLDHLKG